MHRTLFSAIALSAVLSLPQIGLSHETVSEPAALTDADSDLVSANVAGLLDTLTKGLQARRPSEFSFLKKVVNYVKLNKISKKMVLETFHWARRKAGVRRDSLRKYPYPYFQRAIRIRAARVGVKL